MPILPWIQWGRKRFAVMLAVSLLLQPIRGVADHGLDLVLVAVALGSLRMPVLEAAIWGIAAGCLQDLNSICWIGPHTVGNALVAVLASWMKNRIYRERVITQGLLVLGAVFFKQCLMWTLLAWDGTSPAVPDVLLLASRTIIATTAFGFLVTFLLVRYGRRYRDPATA